MNFSTIKGFTTLTELEAENIGIQPITETFVAPFPPFQLAHILYRAGCALKEEFVPTTR